MSQVAIGAPAPELTITGVEPVAGSATPLLRFAVEIVDASGREIYTVALTAQVQIDADRRAYDPATRVKLLDLFGEAERIPQTAGSLLLARVETLVPSFSGRGACTLAVPFSGDVELAATRYLCSLPGDHVPLTFNFSGSIFYCGEADRLQVVLVPWTCSASYRLRVETWQALIEQRYAASGFVRLQADTLDALRRRRAALGLPTFDATIAEALR
jgi:hypothetical protein